MVRCGSGTTLVAAAIAAAFGLAPAAARGQPLYTYSLSFTPASGGAADRAALYDEAAAVTSIQGIVNREAPTLYLFYMVNTDMGSENIDRLWLDRLADPAIGGDLVAGRSQVAVPDVTTLVDTFRSSLRGAAVWDGRVPATVNSAFVAAGVEDLVVVRYDTSPGSLYTRLVASGVLPAVVSLVGPAGEQIFIDDGGSYLVPGTTRPTSQSAKADAHVWACERYMRAGLADPRELGYYVDAWWIEHGGGYDLRAANVVNRDYLVARRGFLVDLQPRDDFPPVDDPGQPTGTDVGVLREMLGAARERAGTDPIAMHGFLSWQLKYVGPDGNAVASEWALVREISPYFVYLDADAPGPSSMANASFYMHLPVSIAPPPQRRPTPEELVGAGHLQGLIANASFEDGDAPWHLETTNRAVYADFSRAHSGRKYLECNTATLEGDREDSLWQDGPAPPPGTTVTLRAFVRSPTGEPVSGELVIWGIDGESEVASTAFTAGAEWSEVRTVLVPARSHTSVRAQLYLRTVGLNLDVDDVAFYAGDPRDAGVVPATYLFWYMGDWDAAAWLYNFTPYIWDAAGRGNVPLAWGFDPELSDRMAPFFRWALATRTPRDFFVGGDSGPGYVNPSLLSAEHLAAWGRFGNAMYRRLDESITGFLLNPAMHLPTAAIAAFDAFSADGTIWLADSAGFGSPGLVGNMPVLRMTSDLNRDSMEDSVGRVLSSTPGSATRPEFYAFRMVLQTAGFMTELSGHIDNARPAAKYRVVDPFAFMELLRRHHGGSNDYRASWIPAAERFTATPGAPFDVAATARNDGWDTWTAAGATPYRIGAHVAASIPPQSLPPDPTAYAERVSLSADVPPGGEVSVVLRPTAPAAGGDYVVQVDVVREGIAWFETQGDLPLQLSVHVCEAGWTACGGRCIDTGSDAENCGACGNACPAGQPCVGGSCGGAPVEPVEPTDGGDAEGDGDGDASGEPGDGPAIDGETAPDAAPDAADGGGPGSADGCGCRVAGGAAPAFLLTIMVFAFAASAVVATGKDRGPLDFARGRLAQGRKGAKGATGRPSAPPRLQGRRRAMRRLTSGFLIAAGLAGFGCAEPSAGEDAAEVVETADESAADEAVEATDGGGECAEDRDCDDRIACTVDHCADGTCTHEPCADCCPEGLRCIVGFGCGVAPPPCTTDDECDDAVRCTLDRCRDATVCEHLAQDDLCGADEICLAAYGCIPPPPTECASADDCFPDRPCIGVWYCDPEFGCQFEWLRDCDDEDDCTEDSCDDAVAGGCVNAPLDADDDDHAAEACDGDDCDDGNAAVHPGATEECNSIDDDCDTLTDETCCEEGAPCATTCGTTGSRECNPDGTVGPCATPDEACNSADDDCDTSTDETFACIPGASASCETGCGSTGTQECGDDCLWGECEPPDEECNGADDDCDTLTDDGFPCVARSTGPCPTGCGSIGTRECQGDCGWGACMPPAEECNGVDDDCDDVADDGFACTWGATRACALIGDWFTGTAVCKTDCSGWDTHDCTNCGDGVIDVDDGEECDGSALGGNNCTTIGMGFGGGTLRCGAACTFDTSGCSNCGNDRIDAGESCDGTALGGADCASVVGLFATGTLDCTPACAFDTSGCAPFNPSGVYSVSPAVSFRCAEFMGSYQVDFSFSSLSFADVAGGNLSVLGAPCNMIGPSARSTGSIVVTCTLPGDCAETYSLSGSFADATHWSATFSAAYTPRYSGACLDCPFRRDWSIAGSR